jgi:hypothetical protein
MNANVYRRVIVAAVAGLALSAASAAALADEATIEVLSIRATKANQEFSPELKAIQDRLKAMNFTGAKLEKRDGGKVQLGQSLEVKLVGKSRVVVTPTKRDAKTIELKIVTYREGKKPEEAVVTRKLGDPQLISVMRLSETDTLVLGVSGK